MVLAYFGSLAIFFEWSIELFQLRFGGWLLEVFIFVLEHKIHEQAIEHVHGLLHTPEGA